VHDANAAVGALLDLHGREGGVVSPDGDELRHVEPQQRDHHVLQVLGVHGRVGTGDADVRAAPEVDAADGLDGERGHVVDVAVHDPLEAVADPDDFHVLQARPDGGRADHAVDAGSRSAPD
jgi:hypothetical protein